MLLLLSDVSHLTHVSKELLAFQIQASFVEITYLLTYSVALVLKQTIPTEQPPLVGEVSANFCG
jgi:hypothetical protein